MNQTVNPTHELRLNNERKHAEVLQVDPERIWGWGTPAGEARARRRAALIIEAGRIRPGSETLEVGCGSGVFTELISTTGASIAACELCPELIALATERDYRGTVQFVNKDISQLGEEHHHRYDVVWGSSVLHHLDLDVFLPRLLLYLRPGGKLVFAEPNMMNPQIWLERHVDYFRKRSGTSPDETAFYRKGITRTLQAVGFEAVSVQPHEFLHPGTPRAMIPMVQKITFVMEKIWPIRTIAGSLLIVGSKPNN